MKRIAISILLSTTTITCYSQTYNIKDFGAKGDGVTLNTISIQRAINKCSRSGGIVVIPEGIFVSGTLLLKSNVTINIQKGGVLKGSPLFGDYPNNIVHYKNAFTHSADGKPNTNKALLFAEGAQNIALIGDGTIDGSGDSPEFNLGNDDTPASRKRPCAILIIDSKNIRLDGLRLTNPAYWLQNYLGCDHLELKNLTIFNQSNFNQDGIDIDASNVVVENCKLDVDDDGICFKSHDRNRPVKDVVVRNCTIASNCNAIKFGTASLGGLQNVKISDCVIKHASVDRIRHWQQKLKGIGKPITVISGIALEAVDGGIIDHIAISDIRMTDVQTPVFIVLGNRQRAMDTDRARASKISNILIENVTAESQSKMASSITAFPSHYIEKVTLRNISIKTRVAGSAEDAKVVLPENPAAYPENRMYGQVYPASIFFLRHVKHLTIDRLHYETASDESRSAICLNDVTNARINLVGLPSAIKSSAVIKQQDCTKIILKRQ